MSVVPLLVLQEGFFVGLASTRIYRGFKCGFQEAPKISMQQKEKFK